MTKFKKYGLEPEIEIDDRLIPLVVALNNVGIRTVGCCQGHEGSSAQLVLDGRGVAVVLVGAKIEINWNLPGTTPDPANRWFSEGPEKKE